ncbi:glycosyltransferase [Geodermatophilus sp. SYSU D00703]
MRPRIVVAGSMAQRPGYGGHAWVFLQYLLGFRRLGHDVLFVDRLEPEMCVDEDGRRCPVERSVNLRYLLDVLREVDLERSFALLHDRGRRVVGMSRAELLERSRTSSMLLNVMGFLDDEEVLGQAPCRVLLDIDPGFGQMWQDLGLHELFQGHDRYVTIGENIGRPDCTIPTCGLDWVTTPQPVVLEWWPAQPPEGRRFTSIASWRGPFAPVEYEGSTYGLRVHEFRRFLSLPGLTGREFEVALDIHEADQADAEALRDAGWQLTEPASVAGTPSTYRRFVQGSGAEFMVAKNMYVRSRSGWVSDRSICYLASGRPVLAQDTGLADRYPLGEGLVTYTTLNEAAAGVEEICGNQRRHARAARDLAEEYFDSDKVLRRLLSQVGVA